MNETPCMPVYLTQHERYIVDMLLRNFRKTTMNNWQQSKNPDKTYLYLQTATVIDQIMTKLTAKAVHP